ncbi:UNVERIFIED_CONTAM: hypothetical protein K2H54_001547 [Gekko kuhli]
MSTASGGGQRAQVLCCLKGGGRHRAEWGGGRPNAGCSRGWCFGPRCPFPGRPTLQAGEKREAAGLALSLSLPPPATRSALSDRPGRSRSLEAGSVRGGGPRFSPQGSGEAPASTELLLGRMAAAQDGAVPLRPRAGKRKRPSAHPGRGEGGAQSCRAEGARGPREGRRTGRPAEQGGREGRPAWGCRLRGKNTKINSPGVQGSKALPAHTQVQLSAATFSSLGAKSLG